MNLLSLAPEVYRNEVGLVLDFETTNLDFGSALQGNNRLVLAAWGMVGHKEGSKRILHKFGSEYEQEELLAAIKQHKFLVAHNAKFELQWLRRCGLDLTEVLVYDTMLAEKVIVGNHLLPLGLDAVCRRYGLDSKHPLGSSLVHAGVSSDLVPESVLLEYCRQDVRCTGDLFRRQLEVLSDRQLACVFTKCLLTPVLADIEFNGMGIDREAVENEYSNLSNRLHDLDNRLVRICGDTNLNSGKQRAAFLYDTLGFEVPRDFRKHIILTAGGQRKTDSKTVQSLKAETKEQKEFLKLYTERTDTFQALSKTITKLHNLQGDVLRAQFHQARTVTGRLSSTGTGDSTIQFQNMARGYKKLFVPKHPGWYECEADGSQLEFRVAAQLGQDERAIKDIRTEGFDVHKLTSEVLGVSRQNAKEHCFPLDTLLLTPAGWKGYKDIHIGDKVINYDSVSGRLVEDVVIDYSEPHLQEVIEMRTRHNWAVRSTPGHRWYAYKRIDHGKKGRGYEPCITFTKDMGAEHRIITAARAAFAGSNGISPREAALLGWAYSDGSVHVSPLTGARSQGRDGWRQNYRLELIQKKYVDEIDSLLSSLGLKYSKVLHGGGCYYWNVHGARNIFRKAGIVDEHPNHSALVLGMSAAARAAWLRAVSHAEGTIRVGQTWRIAQNSGSFCEAIKLAAFLCGYDIRVTRVISKRSGKSHEQITLRNRPYVTGQRITKKSLGEQSVWCVTTRNHTVVIKQGDTYSISGNTFKPLYGGTSGSKRQRAYYEAFRQRYPQIYATQRAWVSEVLETKELRMPWGATWYFPDTKVTESGYVTHTSNIFNYPVQALATAEAIPIALTKFWHEIKARKLRMEIVNTIHDSIVCEVPEDELDIFKQLVTDCMTYGVYKYMKRIYGIDWSVPLGVGIKIGKRWSEGDEIKINIVETDNG